MEAVFINYEKITSSPLKINSIKKLDSSVIFPNSHYDSTVGRWTTKDPIGFNGGDTNLYAYVGGDPMSYVDPDGLWGIQIGYSLGGFVGFGGASISGGIAIVGNGLELSSLQSNIYQSGQFNTGLGLSLGRGVQLSITPDAKDLTDLSGRSFGGGFDSQLIGFGVSRSNGKNTYTISGPSLGFSAFGSISSTSIGSPVRTTCQKGK